LIGQSSHGAAGGVKRVGEAGDHVLGDRAGGAGGGSALQPDGGAGGLEGGHALREEGAGDAGEDVAGAGGGEGGGRGVLDRGAAVGGGDHGVGALEDDHGAGAGGGGAGGGEAVGGDPAEEAGELAGVGGDDGGAAQGVGGAGVGAEGAGVGDDRAAGGERRGEEGAGGGVGGEAGADDPGPAGVVEQGGGGRVGGDDAGVAGAEGGGGPFRRGGEGGEAGAGAAGGGGGQAGGAGHGAAGDRDVAAAVLVGVLREGGEAPEAGGVADGAGGFLRQGGGEGVVGEADIRQEKGAAEGPAGEEEVAGLEAGEGDGGAGGGDVAEGEAGGAVEAAGDVHGEDRAAGGAEGGDGVRRQGAGGGGAEEGVDDEAGAGGLLRGEGDDGAAPAGGGLGGGAVAGRGEGGDGDGPAGVAQEAGGGPAVAAVVAGAGEDEGADGAVAGDRGAGDGAAGGGHEGGDGNGGGGVGAGHGGGGEEVERPGGRAGPLPPRAGEGESLYGGPMRHDVAVIGGGLSGSLLSVLLQRALPSGRSILLLEDGDRPGRGLAYATTDPGHLLNAPAATMGVLPERPEDFPAWREARGGGTGPAAGGDAGAAAGARFEPRGLYGDYAEARLREAAAAPGARLAVRRGRATGIAAAEGGWRVTLGAGAEAVEARLVVLALGHAPAAAVPLAGRGPEALAGLAPEAGAVLVGSGLTAVDALLGLIGRGHRGPVRVVSLHGRLPLPHAAPGGDPWALSEPPAGAGAAGLMRWLRGEARRAAAAGQPWQAVMGAVRGRVPALWRGLSLPSRRIFLARALSAWNIHRHRMPAASASAIGAMRARGGLVLEAARFLRVEAAPGGRVRAVLRGPGGAEIGREADRVVLCTGPGPGRAWSGDALVRGLIRDGLARIDPLGLGLDTEAASSAVLGASGAATGGIWAIGPCAPGALFEVTAVPEIRAQAAALVPRLLAALGEESGGAGGVRRFPV